MKDDGLDHLFERARGSQTPRVPTLPAGFADRVAKRYQLEVYRERTATRASFVSLSAALVIFAAIVGFNFNAITSLGTDDQDPADDVAQVLWDSAGN
jgi:hypothetical protein